VYVGLFNCGDIIIGALMGLVSKKMNMVNLEGDVVFGEAGTY
jgi:hypothetical protein